MDAIQVLVADRYDISRAGILSLLQQCGSLNVVAEASSVPDTIRLCREVRPDVCLVSIHLARPTIREFIRKLKSGNNPLNIVLISQKSDLETIHDAVKAGARGFLTYSTDRMDLCKAIKKVAEGSSAFSAPVSKWLHSDSKLATGGWRPKPLTRREREVMKFIVDGYTSQEIAELLCISPRTVETHRSNLMQKLGTRNTAGLVRYALEQKLTPPD
ncbi:MAG: response regulator transcription factor [Balneolaceae bacterium]